MKKRILLINLGITVTTLSFAASPPMPKFLLNKINKPVVKKTLGSNDNYANFAGHWVGTCDNNPEEEQSTVIEQSDASTIIMDGIELPMDGISSYGFTGNFQADNSFIHYRWNEDGQKILGTGFFYQKAGNMSQGGLDMSIVKFDFAIENGQLVSNFALSSFTDGTSTISNTYRCVYNKSEA